MRTAPFIAVAIAMGVAPLGLAEEPQGPPPPKRHSQQPEHAQAPAPRSAPPRVFQPAAAQPRNFGAGPRPGFNAPRSFDPNGGNNVYRQVSPRYRTYDRRLANPMAEQPEGLSPGLVQPTALQPAGRNGEVKDRRGAPGNGAVIPYSPSPRIGREPSANAGGNDWRDRDGRRRDGDWRDRDGDGRNRNGGNGNYSDACRRYRHERHDRDWWRSRYNRVILISGGYYYWDTGYWYPAWGYDTAYSNYAYDGPIYGYDGLPPDEVITSVQSALQEEGYYQGAVDGELGPMTRQALAAWQRDHGLAITTVIDEPTMQSLGLR